MDFAHTADVPGVHLMLSSELESSESDFTVALDVSARLLTISGFRFGTVKALVKLEIGESPDSNKRNPDLRCLHSCQVDELVSNAIRSFFNSLVSDIDASSLSLSLQIWLQRRCAVSGRRISDELRAIFEARKSCAARISMDQTSEPQADNSFAVTNQSLEIDEELANESATLLSQQRPFPTLEDKLNRWTNTVQGDLPSAVTKTDTRDDALDLFARHGIGVCGDLSLFSTVGGFVGVASASISIGDEIILVRSFSPFLILRRFDEQDEFKGLAHMQDFMEYPSRTQRHIWDDMQQLELPIESFTIR